MFLIRHGSTTTLTPAVKKQKQAGLFEFKVSVVYPHSMLYAIW